MFYDIDATFRKVFFFFFEKVFRSFKTRFAPVTSAIKLLHSSLKNARDKLEGLSPCLMF